LNDRSEIKQSIIESDLSKSERSLTHKLFCKERKVAVHGKGDPMKDSGRPDMLLYIHTVNPVYKESKRITSHQQKRSWCGARTEAVGKKPTRVWEKERLQGTWQRLYGKTKLVSIREMIT
jgi:hypothetical protein